MIYEMRLRVVDPKTLKQGDSPVLISLTGEDQRVVNTRPAILEFYNGIEWKKVEVVLPL